MLLCYAATPRVLLHPARPYGSSDAINGSMTATINGSAASMKGGRPELRPKLNRRAWDRHTRDSVPADGAIYA
eukprot:1088133-Rhodomonas_salina.1